MWLAAVNTDTSFGVFLNSTDTQPQVQLQTNAAGGQILLGIGGSTTPSGRIESNGSGQIFVDSNGQASVNVLALLPGTAGSGSTVSNFTLTGIGGSNGEFLYIEAINATSFALNVTKGGSGSYRPLEIFNGGAEAFRITTTPNIQIASGVNINWNNDAVEEYGNSTTTWRNGVVFTRVGSNVAAEVAIVPNGTPAGTGNATFTAYRTSDALTNPEGVSLQADTTGNPQTFGLFTFARGTGTLRPLLIGIDPTGGFVEVARITTTPTFQFQNTTLTILATGSNTGVTTLTSNNASSSNYTATLPANTGTVAELNLAQTWSAAQTFDSSDLLLFNPAGTFAYTFAGAAIAAARTITLPLLTGNDTMAVLGFAQTFSALQTFTAGDFAFGGYGHDSITSGAKGDIWQYNGTNIVNLGIGSTGQVLTVASGLASWATPATTQSPLTIPGPIVFSGNYAGLGSQVWIGQATGGPFVNAPTGQVVTLSVNNANTFVLGATGLLVAFNIALAGLGFPVIVALTLQKSETGADANVLTYTPPAAAGSYKLHFIADMSADNLAVLGWTATWKDSNGNARAPTNLPIASPDASTTTAAAFTVSDTGAVASTASGVWPINTDNSATSIVIKFTFSGTSIACKVTAWIEKTD